jgi:hypothetical protein
MLVLEIAAGIILAYVLLKSAPLILSRTLDAVAHTILALTTPISLPPFWRNAANKKRGPNPFWVTAIIVGAGAAACGLLSVVALLSVYLGA